MRCVIEPGEMSKGYLQGEQDGNNKTGSIEELKTTILSKYLGCMYNSSWKREVEMTVTEVDPVVECY